jgi:dipeptidase D
MASPIDGLEPALVWKNFAEFSRIPRCSKHEEAAAAFVLRKAKGLGLKARQDAAGNVVVRKPASAGHEGKPSVCLQGHLDMVCEKNADKKHDFTKDPIELVRRDNVLMANGTTLGADNGIAVATNLALMESTGVAHGPLELLFTVDEETGLTGAHVLEPGFIESRLLMNLDSEEEGAIYIGCSGGKDTQGTWALALEPLPAKLAGLEVRVTGLKGGHSGMEIDKGRGNAVKILNRVLIALEACGARLSRLDGGNKRNAIPREASAVVYVPPARLADARAIVAAWHDTARAELGSVEPDLSVAAADVKGRKGKLFPRKAQLRITRAIASLPHGVTKMSADIPGLVETSTNLASIATKGGKVTIGTSQRSAVGSEILEIAQTVRFALEAAGAEVTQGDGYPGWKPNVGSPLLKTARATYKALYGKEPAVKAIHAGLECGIIGEKYPGIDMISFGPTLEGVHSPDEKIFVDTVPRFWDFLLGILKAVA